MNEEVCNDIVINKCICIYILNKDYDKSSTKFIAKENKIFINSNISLNIHFNKILFKNTTLKNIL